MRHLRWLIIVFSSLVFVSAMACGNQSEPSAGDFSVEEGPGDETGYDEDATVVVDTEDQDKSVIIKGDANECVDVGNDTCVDPDEARKNADDPHCDDPDARADVIVEDGEVVDVICYPPKEDGTNVEEVAETEDGETKVPQTENGAVVTFGEDTNGEPIEGDITVDSEQTTLYGNGIDKTIIDGNITVSSNESRVRSMTVDGNVTYTTNSNNSAIAFCKIKGNLTVNSNDFTGTNCVVFGNVVVSGNNARLVNIGVSGSWEVNSNADCKGCYSFTDENEDGTVQKKEKGETLSCGGGGNTNNNGGQGMNGRP